MSPEATLDNASVYQPAYDLQTTKYIMASALALWFYDYVLGMLDEIRLLTLRSFSMPLAVYFLSRIFSALHLFLGLRIIVRPPDYCHYEALATPIEWLVAITMPCNTWLFFIRVKGIYFRSRPVVILFSVLWATTLSSIYFPFSYTIRVVQGEGDSCISAFHLSNHLLPIPLVALVVFDTAVLIAVSVHFSMYDSSESRKARLKALILTSNMGRVTRMFIRSGQIYYVATVGIHVAVAIIGFLPSICALFVGETLVMSSALQNMMVCHAFRLLMFSNITDEIGGHESVVLSESNISPNLQFRLPYSSDMLVRTVDVDPEAQSDRHSTKVCLHASVASAGLVAPIFPTEVRPG